ncbi:MAG: hypothetical protein QXO15_09820 [Nitrososphaerota archaeon]
MSSLIQGKKCLATATILLLTLQLIAVLTIVRCSPGTMSITPLQPNTGPIGTKTKVSGNAPTTITPIKPVKIYWSSDDTLSIATDMLLATITSPKTPSGADFEATITVPSVTSPGTYYIFAWQDEDGDSAIDTGEYASETFEVVWATVTVDPTVVKAGTYEFRIMVSNDLSTASIHTVEITYPSEANIFFADAISPSGWLLYSHSGNVLTFKATGGYEISKGSSQTFKVKLQIASQAGSGDRSWSVNLINTAAQQLQYPLPLTLTVDVDLPTVTISTPLTGLPYSVGAGNRIWINGTASDSTTGVKSLTINNTKFTLVKFADTAFAFANITAIPDGKLAVKITAMDFAENMYSSEVMFYVDNSAPALISLRVRPTSAATDLYRRGDSFYMSGTVNSIQFNVTFSDPAGITEAYMYINGSIIDIGVAGNKTWIPPGGYSVPTTVKLLVINNITLVDNTSPTRNKAVYGPYYIVRDVEKPGVPTFTYETICGGIIIRGLTATDNVAVNTYQVSINGTIIHVPADGLQATAMNTLTGGHITFSGCLVLNLASFSGKVASIRIRAVDYGGNFGDWSATVTVSIPAGEWYPIELERGWNLISLPLIPASTARSDVLSLILKQGAGGVTVLYEYDAATGTWIINPSTIKDGKGYWVHMKAYDVLVVQGRKTPEPPALPTSYRLEKGWNLVGFTSTSSKPANLYLGSLETNSFFKYIYVWDATSQSWTMIDGTSATSLNPGQAFWIYMYKPQDLVPPI